MPMRSELPIPRGRLYYQEQAPAWWSRFFAEINNPNLLAILYFVLIGMLLTAAFVQLFPNFGEMGVLLEQVP